MSIVLNESYDSLSSIENFEQRLAKRPYCSDDLGYGLQIRNKQIALSKKYIQANTPFNLSWLCFDIDYPCVLETTFKEKILPLPNLVVVNPKNNHSHLLYGIKNGIYLTDNATIDPIRYAHAIGYSLREELKADNGYSGLIIKNPTHNYWNTIELEEDLWSLGDLAQYLVLPKTMPKRENLIGLGRNCTLFELGRKYAYSEVLKFKITSTRDSFYNAVLYFIEQKNHDFPEPLLFNEYKAIAKSISNWTWKHYGDKTTKQWAMYVKRTHSVEIQSWRGKQNTSEQQAIKGKKNTSQQQSIKGTLGGLANNSEQQVIKGTLGAIKSAQVRFEGSNEQLKPWESLGISRRTYYRKLKNKTIN